MFPASANIIIIGGGVLGASAAFQLAKDGHQDIVLLDRWPAGQPRLRQDKQLTCQCRQIGCR